MKQLKFLETKRTPRYSLRKFSVGVASVLLGVTIFGINFTNHSVKAATTESVEKSNSPANSNSQQTLAAVLPTTEQTNGQQATSAKEEGQQTSASNNATANNSTEAATTLQSAPKTQGSADTDIKSSAATVDQNNTNTQQATSATEKVRQGSASNNTTANNSTEAATTSQSAPKTQGSADTDIKSLDIRSLTAISAAKLATMNLMQTNGINGTDTDGNAAAKLATMNLLAMNLMKASGTNTGSDRSAAVTVNPDNINTQPDKENQELANKHNLTSSDNYSSNIYQGTDGKYYKIVTIYGNDYVYHTADIQANGDDATAEDTKNNINISKEDLGNGKTRWTVVFFPNKGLQNVGSKLSGLSSAKFGIALTNDYQIVGNVDMDVISDHNQTFSTYIYKPGSNSATETTVQNPPAEVKFSFNPNTDVDQNTGLINSKTMPAYNNKYLQGPYYFTTATDTGKKNLWQTYFKKWGLFSKGSNNAYDGSPYLGNDHELHFSDFKITNKTGVDGAKEGDLVIYDKLGYDKFNGKLNSDGVFSSYNFNQAMEFKSQGVTSQAQFSSYKISFTTQHTDSYEVNLDKGPKNQQFSGISANIYSYQNGHWNMFSRLYGEQRALSPAGVVKQANEVVSGWGDATRAMGQIKKDYLNNAQINVLRNKILNNITDHDAVSNIIKEGNSLNDAMKKLGNSIGQYDSDGSFADHKEDTTKASDRYKYANPDKKAAYDNATEVTKALINKDTGTYANQATVEKLTEAENKAWNELNVVLANKITPTVPATKEPVANTSSLTETEKDKVKKNVEEANKGNFPDGTVVTVGADGTATVTYPDGSKDTIPGDQLVQGQKGDTTDAGNITPTIPGDKVTVKDPSHLTDDEKNQVKNNVDNANKDKFPAGTEVTVGDDGTATIKYPDGSKDTIPGDQLVQGQKGDTTDAGNITPTIPGGKVTVKDPNHLTDN
ncbi:LEA family epithelial adhesin [Lactobacillus crispatus]|uniref:LEA family epithelial adhesin n=4 Tax=Lactobacillus crispatus TaxID=47770 RepID=UPI001F0D945A|nr:LEA family epithelial adhesin [Lactobacillus crispatus]